MKNFKKIEIKIINLKKYIEKNNKKINELTKINTVLSDDLKKLERVYAKAIDLENELSKILNNEKKNESNNLEATYE